jgi:hypothetical protein
MALVISEIEKFRKEAPELFMALTKIVDAYNRLPMRSGTGSPEGIEGAPAGTLYCRRDPLMGEMLFVKSTPDGNTGWVPVANAASGLVRSPRMVGGSTSAAGFTKVNGGDQIVIPPNCYSMSFNLTFTGTGQARIKIGPNTSNTLTASGVVTVNGLMGGARQDLSVEALAGAGSVTAMLELVETTVIAASQLTGGTAVPGGSPPPEVPPDPPPPETPRWGEGSGEFPL